MSQARGCKGIWGNRKFQWVKRREGPRIRREKSSARNKRGKRYTREKKKLTEGERCIKTSGRVGRGILPKEIWLQSRQTRSSVKGGGGPSENHS